MDRINDPSAPNRRWVAKGPNVAGTIMKEEWLQGLDDELANAVEASGQLLNASDSQQLAKSIQMGIPQDENNSLFKVFRKKVNGIIKEYGCTILGVGKGFRVETAGCKQDINPNSPHFGKMIYTDEGAKASYFVLHDGDLSGFVSAHPDDPDYLHARQIGQPIPNFYWGLQIGDPAKQEIRGAVSTRRNLKISIIRKAGATELWPANSLIGIGDIVTNGGGIGDMIDLSDIPNSPLDNKKAILIKQSGFYGIHAPLSAALKNSGSSIVAIAILDNQFNFIKWAGFNRVVNTHFSSYPVIANPIFLQKGQHLCWLNIDNDVYVHSNQAHTELGISYYGQ